MTNQTTATIDDPSRDDHVQNWELFLEERKDVADRAVAETEAIEQRAKQIVASVRRGAAERLNQERAKAYKEEAERKIKDALTPREKQAVKAVSEMWQRQPQVHPPSSEPKGVLDLYAIRQKRIRP